MTGTPGMRVAWASLSVAKKGAAMDRLLTVGQAAELLGTSERFPRRLISERRITFVKIGRHVRIPEKALAQFIEAATVDRVTVRWRQGGVV